MSLTVVGTVALDTVSSPFGSIETGLGGSATHFSAAAIFFQEVHLSAVIGTDFPEEHIEWMKERGIGLEDLQRLPGKSFRWTGKYDYDLNTAHTLETQLNVLTDFNPRLKGAAKDSKFLFLGNIAPDIQDRTIDQMSGKPFIALDTMNFWIEDFKPDLLKVLKRVNMLVINEGEARLLSQEHNLIKAAKTIRAMGPETLLIKQGEYGALAFQDNQIFHAAALPLEDIMDPTGAGDSFAGGVMGYLSRTNDTSFPSLKRAMIYGSVMASFIVEDFSCKRLQKLKKNEVADRYLEFCSLTHFENYQEAKPDLQHFR